MQYLKQSTAATLKIGPFIDDSDGKTAETGLTIAQADIRLSKNGGDIAQKTEATSCTHDELGIYGCPIDATDTATLGRLQLWVHESGALPVWHEFLVIPANVYDSLFSTDKLQVDVTQLLGTACLTPGVAGTPDVNAKLLGGTAQTGNDVGADVNDILTDTGTTLDTLIKDIPTVSEFEARSILAADYVVVGDTIAGVTAVTNDVGITQAGADKVWGTATRALTDKVGFGLSTAGILAIWHQLTANIVTADTIGKLLKDDINATISSRSSHAAADIWSVVTRALTDKAGFALSSAAITAIFNKDISAYSGAGYAGTYLKNLYDNQGNWITATGFSTSGALATAQSDLDIITGASGVVIQDGTIVAASLGADCITNAKIADNAIAVENIKDSAISAAKIATDAITATKIAANAIGSSEFAQAAADKVRASVCVTGDPANSIGKILHEIYANRLTSARAGYLANINNANLATIADISTLTATEIAYLNASISSRSSHTAANVWAVGTRALTDKAGFGLSAAGITSIWEKNISAFAGAGYAGTYVKTLYDDWINAGRLDAILDIIAADVVNIDGDAMRGTDGANTTTPPTVNAIADQVWDEILTAATHNIATSAGRRLRQAADVMVIRDGTCQAGGGNSEIILDSGASAVNDFYINNLVILTSGTGVGQQRHIDSYVGATKTATVNRAWTTNPDATTTFTIKADSTKHVHGFETAAKAEIESEANDALVALKLDHLIAVADGDDPVNNSIIAMLAATDGDWSNFAKATEALQAIRDRGDAAWITGGGGGITDILQVVPSIPTNIDLANTKTIRIALYLLNSLDDLPSTAEIVPGTITIERSADGGTSWSVIVNAAACTEQAGQIYYDEVFDSGTGYASGDMIRITFKSQKITVVANDYEITDATYGWMFHTRIDGGGAGASAASIADAVWDELSTGHTGAGKAGQQLWTDVDAILTDTGTTLDALIKRVLGLTQENHYIDNTTFTTGKLTAARIRIYSVAGSVGSASDVIATYNIATTYDANGNMETYKVTKA